MPNVLIISDIHINDYNRFNYKPLSRLNQFELLADRIVEIGKLNDCTDIFIAGDIIDKPTSRPYVNHMVARFLRKLGNNFNKIYYILGQHDCDNKHDNHPLSISIIHELMPDNSEYMDKKVINYNDKKVAFMDWRMTQDLSWLQSSVDLFIGHVTVSDLFGQEIDRSKFSLGIVGDIHVHGKDGNLMKIGVPIQHNMNDQHEGTVIIWNSETNEAKYEKVDPDHSRFLQIKYTNDENLDGFSEDNLTYYIYRPKLAKGNTISKSVDNVSQQIDTIIKDELSNTGLTSVHNQILGLIKSVDVIDFNFSLNYIDIENVRSIRKLHYDFKNNLVVTGNNGSGKSSFILALYKGLVGDRSLGQMITKGESKMKIEISLQYEGKEYIITRGTSWGLKINGIPEPYNNKSQFDSDVYIKLPFIRYIDSYYFNYWNIEFLGNINNNRRVELITKYNRLDILDSYFNAAQEKIQELSLEVSSNKRDISEVSAKLEEVKNQYETLSNRITELRQGLSVDKSYCVIELAKYDRYQKYKLQLSELNTRLELAQKTINDFNRSEFDKSFDNYNSTNLKLKSKESEMIQLQSDFSEVSSLREKIKSEKKTIKKLIEELSSIKSQEAPKCPLCGSILSDESLDSTINQIIKDIDLHKETVDNLIVKGTTIANRYPSKIDDYVLSINKELKELREQLFDYQKEYFDNLSKEKSFNEAIKNKEVILNSISKLGEVPEKSDLNDEDILDLREKLTIYAKIDELENQLSLLKIDNYKENLVSLNATLEDNQVKLNKFISYRDIMSKNGSIYKKFLIGLADKLSNDRFKFNVVSNRVSGAEFFDVNVQLKVNGSFTQYKDLSSGQKTLADLYFISRVINKGGILVMDEYLRFLDDENHEDAINLIQDTDVNQIILSTHNPNVYLNNSENIRFNLGTTGTEFNIY